MPSYMTLTVLALAASTASPVFSAPLRVTRERAPTHPKLAGEKRIVGFGAAAKAVSGGFSKIFGGGATKAAGGGAKVVEGEATKVAAGGATKVAEDGAAKAGEEAAKKGGWGQRIKNLALGLVVGGVGAVGGTDIYQKMNPHSEALGAGEPSSTPATTSPDTGYPTTTDPGYTDTGYPTTPGPYYTSPTTPGPYYTSPATPGPYYTSPTSPGPYYTGRATTTPSTRGADSDIFARSDSNLNSRTSPHENLLSRADLEKAITLFTRMLDELD